MLSAFDITPLHSTTSDGVTPSSSPALSALIAEIRDVNDPLISPRRDPGRTRAGVFSLDHGSDVLVRVVGRQWDLARRHPYFARWYLLPGNVLFPYAIGLHWYATMMEPPTTDLYIFICIYGSVLRYIDQFTTLHSCRNLEIKASAVKYHELRTYLLTMFGLKTNIDKTYWCMPIGSCVVAFTMGILHRSDHK